jgi:hypothetical protein
MTGVGFAHPDAVGNVAEQALARIPTLENELLFAYLEFVLNLPDGIGNMNQAAFTLHAGNINLSAAVYVTPRSFAQPADWLVTSILRYSGRRHVTRLVR